MKIYYNTSGQYRVDESGTKTVTGKGTTPPGASQACSGPMISRSGKLLT